MMLNELSTRKQPKMMTTKEIAEQLKTSSNVITNACKKCLPSKKIRHGKPTYWNEDEVTVILRYLQNNRTCNPTYNNLIISTKTSKSDELDYLMLVKQQQEIQEKLNAYQDKRIRELEQEKVQLQIRLDESKNRYSVKRMEKLNKGMSFDWRMLKRESERLGIEVKKVFDQNYGEVNAYHKDVWESLYFDTLDFEE